MIFESSTGYNFFYSPLKFIEVCGGQNFKKMDRLQKPSNFSRMPSIARNLTKKGLP